MDLDPWAFLPPLLEAHHPGLGAHSLRTCQKAAALADRLEMGEEERLAFSLGALYHDVGKLFLPPGLLAAERTLTPEETILRSPARSLRLSPRCPVTPSRTITNAGMGRATLSELAGTRIPFAARLLAIADVYDALTHRRSYGPVLGR